MAYLDKIQIKGTNYDIVDTDGRKMIATPYENQTYPVAVGEYCIQNNKLYRCNTTIQASETWTAAHWTEAQVGDEVASLKSAITEQTYNLVIGKIEGRTINSSGQRCANSGTDLWAAPVEEGKSYTIKSPLPAWSAMVIGYFASSPIETTSVTTYNNSRTLLNSSASYTITAPIPGYVGFIANAGSTEVQVVEGSTDKDYIPTVTATDYVARNTANILSAKVEANESEIAEIKPFVETIGKIVPQAITASQTIDNKAVYYNGTYNRVAPTARSGFSYAVYPVVQGTEYIVRGYGNNTEAYPLAVVADAILTTQSYVNLLQVVTNINTGDASDISVKFKANQDGYLHVNYRTSEALTWLEVAVETLVPSPKIRQGVLKSGTNYQHYCHAYGEKYLLHTIAPYGINNLYEYKQLAIGHFDSDGEIVVDSVVWNAFTDQIGPVFIKPTGVASGEWSGGAHGKEISGTNYPTAKTNSVHVYVEGADISNYADGYYEGNCEIIAENYLYEPNTITGSDLSTATLGIIETRRFILEDTLKVTVKLNIQETMEIPLYYGMQGQINHASKLLLPTAGMEFNISALSEMGIISQSKEWHMIASDANGWHYDMVLDKYGLGDWNKNDGTSTYGRINHYSTTKLYYVLCPNKSFTAGDVLYWAGEYRTYHD